MKVLDFGLAKSLEPDPGEANASDSPTITSPATTHAGGSHTLLVLADALTTMPGSWNRDGVILFTPTTGSPLFRVSSTGNGKPSPVTSLDTEAGEIVHGHPSFLPDGRHFVYLAQTSGGIPHGVYVGSLDSSDRVKLFDAGPTHSTPPIPFSTCAAAR